MPTEKQWQEAAKGQLELIEVPIQVEPLAPLVIIAPLKVYEERVIPLAPLAPIKINKNVPKASSKVIEVPIPPTPTAPTEIENALYLLNGEEINSNKIQFLDKSKIKSVDVIKGENATKVYGDKAKNGVISITMKLDNETYNGISITSKNNIKIEMKSENGNTVIGSANSLKMPENVLFVLDCVIVESEIIKDINTNDIKHVTVLKGESAIKLYGEKGEKGVIVITTKKPIL